MGQAEINFSQFFDTHDDVHPFAETRDITENNGALRSTWPIELARKKNLVDEDGQPVDDLQVRPFYTDDGELGLLLEEQ